MLNHFEFSDLKLTVIVKLWVNDSWILITKLTDNYLETEELKLKKKKTSWEMSLDLISHQN
jgi:plasmid maintenance system killer protein